MNLVNDVLEELKKGNSKLAFDCAPQLNEIALNLLSAKSRLEPENVDILGTLVRICNIVYNNTDASILPISDGVYDHLVELYKVYNPNYEVGADIIQFNPIEVKNTIHQEKQMKEAIHFDVELTHKIENGFFPDEILFPDLKITYQDLQVSREINNNQEYISKRTHNTTHNHPELVGTLDKCKFVLNKDAADLGVLNDSNVKILERDFFAEHIKAGIIDPRKVYTMCCELKYDGVSVEADCSNTVLSARSRGDTGIGQASDMTPIFGGYQFPHIKSTTEPVGIKFEAIILKDDLERFNQLRGYNYKNCRTAIVGLTGASDAYKYRDLITLVPLQIDEDHYESIGGNRISEIEFLNEYFATHGCPMRYVMISGTYIELLFQIKLFLEECNFYRKYIPFMYDGIVVSYVDEDIRRTLGRENFINKYSMAVKFDPLQQETIFRGYQYTVGQDGSITPMIYYDPVEFYGTIHPKSSGHSYARFKELNLAIGDIIDVKYMNDVMPYVSKPFNEHNENNPNPPEQFPTHCPVCGGVLEISSSGKSVKCINSNCGGRSIARMVNMFSKLNIAEFGEATVQKFGKIHLKDIIEIYRNGQITEYGFGPGEEAQLNAELKKIYQPIDDYRLFGSIGFTSVAEKTWQLIFQKYTPEEFVLHMDNPESESMLTNELLSIKGIGKTTVDTIIKEYPYFRDDILYCINGLMIIESKGSTLGKQIRATGFRNRELFQQLQSMGYDADDNAGVTKSTDILLVPFVGYDQGEKVKKASNYGSQIVPVEEFISNMDKYL